MSYHGSSRASLENAVARAVRRQFKADKIARWNALRNKHIKETEAYQKVVEEAERVGLHPVKRRTGKHAVARLHSGKSKKPVTLAGVSVEVEIDERTLAEDRTIEAFAQAIATMSFHLIALSQIPNPTARYKNRVNQKYLVDLVSQLARALNITSPFNEEIQKPRVPMKHSCIDCGGPACIEVKSHWYCEDCAP